MRWNIAGNLTLFRSWMCNGVTTGPVMWPHPICQLLYSNILHA